LDQDEKLHRQDAKVAKEGKSFTAKDTKDAKESTIGSKTQDPKTLPGSFMAMSLVAFASPP
jgi:hypothetical protein